MAKRLLHRGPDGQGFHYDGPLGLGHQRLAIVDEVHGGQPLHNEDRSVWMVCNGQIDNAVELTHRLKRRGHTFLTASDNEAVVHLYEEHPEAFLHKLEGMFALALWDSRKQRLLLVRDPFGIKPLYYTIHSRGVRFASEPASLLLAPDFNPEAEPLALRDCLVDLAVDDHRSAFRHIHRLPAGHRLVVERGAARLHRYFEPPFAASPSTTSRSRAASARELRSRLDACVAKSLRADQPVGAFLSGGLDSSALVALAVRHQPGLPTFSASIDSPGFNEVLHSRVVATRFGTRHRELRITADDIARTLPFVLDHLDEPFADASILPTYLLSRFAREHVKAVIGGEGIDELQGGNFWHRMPRLRARGLTTWPGAGPDVLGDLVTGDFRAALRSEDRGSTAAASVQGARERSLRDDLTGYLPSDLLHKVDRGGMWASLECRVPALSRAFADFSTALPVSYRVDTRQGKKLMRHAFRGLLPASILTRRKQGFALPLDTWLWQKGRLRDHVHDVLFSARSRQRDLFDPSTVARLWREHDRLEALHGYRLWTLFVIEAWHARFIDAPRTFQG